MVLVMAQDYKEKIMKIIIVLFLLTQIVLGQSAPSGYTTNYNLRLYSQGSNPGADSLNQNCIDADNSIKAAYDSANRQDYWTEQRFRTSVKFYGSASMQGTGFGWASNFTPSTLRTLGTTDGHLLWYGLASVDTLATRSYLRSQIPTLANVVDLSSDQNVGGNKTFTRGVGFSSSGTLTLPITNEYPPGAYLSNAIYGNQAYVFYTKTGGSASNRDTLSTHNYLRNYLTASPQSIVPLTNYSRNLGTSSFRWDNTYTRRLYVDTVIASVWQPAPGDTVLISTRPIQVGGLTIQNSDGGLSTTISAAGITVPEYEVVTQITGNTHNATVPIIYMMLDNPDTLAVLATNANNFTLGAELTIINSSSNTLTIIDGAGTDEIKHDSSGTAFVLERYGVMRLWYDRILSLWVCISKKNNS